MRLPIARRVQPTPAPNEELYVAGLLVQLTTNQDQVSDRWLTFLLAMQTALGVAFWVMSRSINLSRFEGRLELVALSVFLPAASIVVATLMYKVIIHERRWQRWYAEQIDNKPLTIDKLMPKNGWEVYEMPLGAISKKLRVVFALTISAWIIAGAMGLFIVRQATFNPSASAPAHSLNLKPASSLHSPQVPAA